MAEPLLTAMTLPMITAAELISSPFSFQNTENSYTAPESDLMEACQQPPVKAQRLVTVAIEICNSVLDLGSQGREKSTACSAHPALLLPLTVEPFSRHLRAAIRQAGLWFWGASWQKEGCLPLQTCPQPGLAGLAPFPALSRGATGSQCGACWLSP